MYTDWQSQQALTTISTTGLIFKTYLDKKVKIKNGKNDY